MPQIWQPLFDTIKMSLLGSFIGSILVVPFAMLASTNIIHSRVVVAAMRLLLSIIRTLPTLVSALIATYIFGLGTLAGTTAIAIFTFAYIGKILYEEIETVDMGPFEAMEAMGATKVRSFISAIVPQVLPSLPVQLPVLLRGQRALRLHSGLCGRRRPWPDLERERSAGGSMPAWV